MTDPLTRLSVRSIPRIQGRNRRVRSPEDPPSPAQPEDTFRRGAAEVSGSKGVPAASALEARVDQLRATLRREVVTAFETTETAAQLIESALGRWGTQDPSRPIEPAARHLRESLEVSRTRLDRLSHVYGPLLSRLGVGAEPLLRAASGSALYALAEDRIRAGLFELTNGELGEDTLVEVDSPHHPVVDRAQLTRLPLPEDIAPVYVDGDVSARRAEASLPWLIRLKSAPTVPETTGIFLVTARKAAHLDPATREIWSMSLAPPRDPRFDLATFSTLGEEICHSRQPDRLLRWLGELEAALQVTLLQQNVVKLSADLGAIVKAEPPELLERYVGRVATMLAAVADSEVEPRFLADHNVTENDVLATRALVDHMKKAPPK